MTERTGIYFASDVHLGLKLKDPEDRERRFVDFLKGIPRDSARTLYLLGDIWDFWYEYRDVILRLGIRVVAELISLMDAGVEVCYFPGNHDIWCYSFFESIGIRKMQQPGVVAIDGKVFCMGHGDLLGGSRWSYRFMLGVFRCRPIQKLFSTIHPTLAFKFGLSWSNGNRRKHKPYRFRYEEEPLYRFAEEQASKMHVDYFVFGHFHCGVDTLLPGGERLIVLKDWMDGGEPYAYYDCATASFSLHFQDDRS